MARLYSRTSKGRTALLSSPVRLTRSRNTNNSASTSGKTYPVPSKTSALAPTRVIKTKRKQTSLNILNDSYGSQEDGISDSAEDAQDADNDGDDDEEEEEEDEEEPDDHAPPFASKLHRAGRIVSPNDYEEGLFASLDDDDDDDVYEAVNDISDYEDDVGEADVENFALQDIMAMGPTVFESESEDDPNAILDDIDGLSVLGFGGDFDGLEGPSSSDDSSSSTSIREVVMERRVRFHSDVDESNVLTGSVSPLLTRALLPSALPDNYGIDRSVIASDMGRWSNRPITSQRHGFFEDDDDSDATDEDLPPEAHTTPNALHKASSDFTAEELPLPPSTRRDGKKFARRPQGPPKGFFQVDRNKPWAILDPSGKKIIMVPAPDTDRHDWLEERYSSVSPHSSPSTSFAQLLDESDEDILESTPNGASVDLMLAGLNSVQNNDADRGHATGPSEAFYPPAGYQVVGDYVVGPDDINSDKNSDVSNEGDLPMTMDDLIEFDDDEGSEMETPTTPTIFMPPLHELSSARSVNEEFAHLNNRNVTAFRRSADPARAALNRLHSLPDTCSSPTTTAGPSTPTYGRKRKAAPLPYEGRHYDGVTPVQRKVVSTTKRRKVMP